MTTTALAPRDPHDPTPYAITPADLCKLEHFIIGLGGTMEMCDRLRKLYFFKVPPAGQKPGSIQFIIKEL